MNPTFTDFFKSYYYSNTYLPAVDLSDNALSQHLLEKENPEIAAKAQELISTPEVKEVLSKPLTYDLTNAVPENNAILSDHGFDLLGRKPNVQTGETIPFYSVIEHNELPGWIIKSGASRIPNKQLVIGPLNDRNEMAIFTKEESILRIEMAKRIQKIADEANIDVVIPKKRLVTYANLEGNEKPDSKYCVICEKINLLSVENTVETIKGMDDENQREVARKIASIVQKAGLVDASFDNIRLTPSGKLAFIDTEPAGLMVSLKSGLLNKLFPSKGSSVEKCTRIGLYTLMHQTSKVSRGTQRSVFDGLCCEPGLEAFRAEVQEKYEQTLSPKFSKWKIVLSVVSVGLLPLVYAVSALVKSILTKNIFKKLNAIDTSFILNNGQTLVGKSKSEQALITAEYEERRAPLAKKFFASIEGVPFKSRGFRL